jgi:hypothetical protein
MSINRNEQLSSSGSYIFRDYATGGGSGESLQEQNNNRRKQQAFNDVENYDFYSLTPAYKIPLDVVKKKVFSVDQKIQEVLSIYEDFLEKVYINPFLDNDIEESHYHIFEEVEKNHKETFDLFYKNNLNSITTQVVDEDGQPQVQPERLIPDYISFAQYVYAETHGCRGCRKFVKEYDRLISHSSFVHLFDFRYYLTLILNESKCIKNSLLYDFGGEYEDESQEQAAIFYYSWAKMAENHTRIITEELTQEADELSTSEVDIISKKQAAQFQAFFSIRIASYSETIDNSLFNIKKDLVDNCDILYERYISPSLKFKTQVAAPLQLDIETTNMSTIAPILSEEVITAINAFRGNFGSILSDLVQRRNNLNSKFNKLLSLNLQRRKYIGYIDQLAEKASSRPKVIVSVSEDKTSKLFQNIFIDSSKRESLKSSHSNLDDLEANSHPQYLLRSGGSIFGDLTMQEGATIDGVDIDTHAHTGDDGSVKIKSTDIDYQTARDELEISLNQNPDISINIDKFNSDIRQGGVPVTNATLNINIPDQLKDLYEFEILYRENE